MNDPKPLAITFSDVDTIKKVVEDKTEEIEEIDFVGTDYRDLASFVYNTTYVPNEPDRMAERNFKAQSTKPQNINRTTFR